MVAELSRPVERTSLPLCCWPPRAPIATPSGAAERANPAHSGTSPARLRRGAEEWFTDRARESGLDFVHFNGMTGRFHFPEVIPPGVALLDYDDDGDLDVFVVQGQMLGKQPSAKL